jgi:hypothetical protein
MNACPCILYNISFYKLSDLKSEHTNYTTYFWCIWFTYDIDIMINKINTEVKTSKDIILAMLNETSCHENI